MKQILFACLCLTGLTLPAAVEVETWRVFELETSGSPTAEIDYLFTHESGETIRRPAFWDGGGILRVRFAPTKIGTWTWRSTAGESGELRAVPYKGDLPLYRHGFVRVEKGKKHFVHADGTPFFYLGDTHWNFHAEEIDSPGPSAGNLKCDSHFKYIVDTRVEQGFTVYQSEPISATFDLTDGEVDASDIPGFQRADRYYRYIADAGLVHANAEFFFASRLTPQLAADDVRLKRLSRYWVARFGAYPVMWTLAQEIDNDFYAEGAQKPNPVKFYTATNNPWVKIAKFLHEADAYNHPLSGHQENAYLCSVTGEGTTPDVCKVKGSSRASVFRDEKVSEETGHNWWAAQWKPNRRNMGRLHPEFDYWKSPKPAVNYEGDYCNLWTRDHGERAQAYISYLSGFCGFGYGATDIWLYRSTYEMNQLRHEQGIDYINPADKWLPWSQSVHFPSAVEMRYLRNFFDSFDWWRMEPLYRGGEAFAPAHDNVICRVARIGGRDDQLAFYFYGAATNRETGAFKRLQPQKAYLLKWYDTRAGIWSRPSPIRADVSGCALMPDKPNSADWAALLVDRPAPLQPKSSTRVRKFSPKVPDVFTALTPGAVKPRGWIRDREVAMARGYLDTMSKLHHDFKIAWSREFRPPLDKMSWEEGAWSFEAGGYWFDGLVRAAAQLEDSQLADEAKARFEPVLADVTPDSIALLSWLKRDDKRAMDALTGVKNSFPLSKSGLLARCLDAYWDVSRDPRVPQILAHAFDDVRFLGVGAPIHLPAAAFEAWRLTGDARTAQALDKFFADVSVCSSSCKRYAEKPDGQTIELSETTFKDWVAQHGVAQNESMVSWLRGWQWTGNRKFLDALLGWQDYLKANAMQPHGVIVADEAFGHPGPDRGTETCTVVASLWLKLQLLAATGNGRWADEAERILLNAAPNTVSRDYTRHVYFQTPNRITPLKPVYPHETPLTPYRYERRHHPMCCTADLVRLIPIGVQYKWLVDGEGIVAALYGPDETTLNWQGNHVKLTTVTDYPFEERIVIYVEPTRSGVEFALKLRVPAWCANPAVRVDGVEVGLKAQNGFAAIRRKWSKLNRVELTLPMKPTFETGCDYNAKAAYGCVRYGPLLMCAPLKEFDENNPVWHQPSDWKLDPKTVLDGVRVVRTPLKPGFDWPLDAPVKLEVNSSRGRLTLVPYGSAKFRVTMFPLGE